MSQITVTSIPAPLPVVNSGSPVIQNLGPADVYIGNSSDVDETSGFKIASGTTFPFTRPLGLGGGKLYIVTEGSESDTEEVADVRYLLV